MKHEFAIEVPKLGEFLLGSASRKHNALVKVAVRAVLMHHWRNRIPGHFQRPAHNRYGYAQRNARYRFSKQRKYGSSIDLVRTGRTRHVMTTQSRITVGGQASSGGVTGRLLLRFPFPGGTRRFRRPGSRQAITIEQMAREIETIIPTEVREIEQQIREFYMVLIETDTSKRQRVKV